MEVSYRIAGGVALSPEMALEKLTMAVDTLLSDGYYPTGGVSLVRTDLPEDDSVPIQWHATQAMFRERQS